MYDNDDKHDGRAIVDSPKRIIRVRRDEIKIDEKVVSSISADLIEKLHIYS